MQNLKKYLILGVSGATGSTIAKKLLEDGAYVCGTARDMSSTESLAAQYPERFRAMPWASSDGPDALKALCDEAAAWNETGLDGVVVAIGSIYLKPAHMTRETEWQDVLLTNLSVPFWAARAALPHLTKSPHSSMVFFSSVAAQVGLSNHDAIAAAKAGVEGLVRSLAATYASKGVRVNAIAPSLTKSKMSSRFGETVFQNSARNHPLGRTGEPQDLSSMAVFLLSDKSEWITGQIFSVDGGMSSLRMPL